MRQLLVRIPALFSIVLFTYAMPAVAAQKTFVFCAEGSPSTFNPQNATDGPSFNASSRAVYNRLVEFKIGTTDIVPGLAEKWTISKDGKTYRFFLRKNVEFHSSADFKPTRNFNADDVIYSFEVQKDSKHPFRQKDDYEYFSSMEMDKVIQQIKKIDDYTVEM
ncbi:MAG: ABC transporter substrate-binding protein, partial [Pseudobdellovibrionaceae bacterium]